MIYRGLSIPKHRVKGLCIFYFTQIYQILTECLWGVLLWLLKKDNKENVQNCPEEIIFQVR